MEIDPQIKNTPENKQEKEISFTEELTLARNFADAVNKEKEFLEYQKKKIVSSLLWVFTPTNKYSNIQKLIALTKEEFNRKIQDKKAFITKLRKVNENDLADLISEWFINTPANKSSSSPHSTERTKIEDADEDDGELIIPTVINGLVDHINEDTTKDLFNGGGGKFGGGGADGSFDKPNTEPTVEQKPEPESITATETTPAETTPDSEPSPEPEPTSETESESSTETSSSSDDN